MGRPHAIERICNLFRSCAVEVIQSSCFWLCRQDILSQEATPSNISPRVENMGLDRYRDKRHFPATPEPEGSEEPARGGLIFVVQKHAATRLHYDFRLEWDGVLKSWAVPKGPSYDPKDKRLAVHVEDHPLDYAAFEGVIPEKRYGAGNVIVWDYGYYSPDDANHLSFDDRQEAEERMRRQMEAGKLSITLRGVRLMGSWTLVKTRGRAKDSDEWLLIKHQDEYSGPAATVDYETSAITGRTLDEVSRGVPRRKAISGVEQSSPLPNTVPPMNPSLASKPFSHGDWLFEPKLDGVRALAFLRGGTAILRARSDANITNQYPEVARAVASLPMTDLVADGEIVALNESGVPDFELLQQRMHVRGDEALKHQSSVPVVYYVFDLLYLDGRDLRGLPLRQRKLLLRQHLPESELVRPVHYLEGDGERFFDASVALGLEGIVAKRLDSPYESGARSGSWLKIKAQKEQEFVVCGYLPGHGHRASSFGALVLGYYEGTKLKYAGTVGSGFRDSDLSLLRGRLIDLTVDVSPFEVPIARQAEKPKWVRPVLVIRVKFASWTRAGVLRAPVFLGTRTDIDAQAVVRERAVEPHLEPTSGTDGKNDLVASLCEQLADKRDRLVLRVGEESIALTNLNKVLWPAKGRRAAMTKRDLIRYLVIVSPHMLPHLKDRPMNLARYPDGIEKAGFYQKHWSTELPPYVSSIRLYSADNHADQDYVMVNNLATLVWLGQLAALELHPWLSRVVSHPDASALPDVFTGSEDAIDSSVLNYPDFMIFDLDPYIYSGKEGPRQEPELNRKGFERVREVAFALKDVLEELSLKSFIKTSGKTGLHIYVCIMRHYSYDFIRRACGTIGQFLSVSVPGAITLDRVVERRTDKIFFDHNQNGRGRTLAAPYSPRPTGLATVSAPITWEELASVYPTDFTLATLPGRLAKVGDLWQGILEEKHDLRPIFEGDGPMSGEKRRNNA